MRSMEPMKRFLSTHLLAFVIAMAFVPPAIGQGSRTSDAASLKQIETYLDSIRTMRSKFYQVGADGSISRGVISMMRPGRLRIEYAPPTPALIVADGKWLIYYDKELEEPSYVSIDDTLAGFLIRPNIRLSGDIKITRHIRDKGVIRVSLQHREEPEQGTLTLVFSKRPLRLRQWQVIDAQGGDTRVSLIEPGFGVPLDPSLFEFTAPEKSGGE